LVAVGDAGLGVVAVFVEVGDAVVVGVCGGVWNPGVGAVGSGAKALSREKFRDLSQQAIRLLIIYVRLILHGTIEQSNAARVFPEGISGERGTCLRHMDPQASSSREQPPAG
jgi:hypothetical protein